MSGSNLTLEPVADTVAGVTPISAHPRYRMHREPELSKKSLAEHYGRTVRWVEKMLAAGMPSRLVNGKRMFRLSETDEWLGEGSAA